MGWEMPRRGLFLQTRDLILSKAAPHTRQNFPCFKGLKTLRLCWGIGRERHRRASNRSSQEALAHPRCFVSRRRVRQPPFCTVVISGLVGQELDAQDPLGTGDIQPVHILSPAMEYCWNCVADLRQPNPPGPDLVGPSPSRGHPSPLPPPPPNDPPPLLLGRVHTLNLPPPDRYILPISVGVPYLGDGPVNPSAAFQNGDGEATDRSHTVQNISPLDRTLAPRQDGLS